MPLSILLQSNSPWTSSGYGTTTKFLAEIWRKLGHRIGIFASFGAEGGFFKWEGFDIFPRGYNQYGSDVAFAHAKKFGADLVITNVDTFVLNDYGRGGVPWIPIAPVMEDPLTPQIRGSLAGAYGIVSISEYGQQVMKEAGIESTLIPLPIDTGKFYPLNKRDAKIMLGFDPDSYVIGNVGMNRGNRKGHDILLNAFAKILSEIPNAVLYIHTDMKQPDGLALESMSKSLGIQPGQLRFPSQYDAFFGQSADWMNALYNAFDLYVQPSRNEGQSMTVWEAYSAGLPVVATDCTALSEAIHAGDALGLAVVNKNWQPGTGFSYDTSAGHVYAGIMRAIERWGKGYISTHNRQLAIDRVSLNVVGLAWQDYLLGVEEQIRYAPRISVAKRTRGAKLKIAQVTTQVANCGVGAYTRSLSAGLKMDFELSTHEIRTLTDAKHIPDDVDIVHVQHEPSIVPPNRQMEKALKEIRLRGTKVVTTYHNVIPQVVEEDLRDDVFDVGLVHWPHGQTTQHPKIKILGGMGCPTFAKPRNDMRAGIRAGYGFKENDLIISTFGFASIGRGHFELPMEMIGTLKAYPHMKFQLIIPGNFMNPEGQNYVLDNLALIKKRHGLENQIIVISDFLPDHEVLLRLWMSDIGYLYLGMDTNSSSSAIRFFISARLPLVITPSTHFADVRRGVIITESYSLPESVQMVQALAYDPLAQDRLRKEHEYNYRLWQWPMFTERVAAIYNTTVD